MKGNFRFFKNFTYFVPGGAQIAVLFFWFVVGALLGNILVFLMALCLPSDVISDYGTIVAYPVMFIPPMIYASGKSRLASINRQGVLLDNSHFKPFSVAILLLMLAVATLALGLICEPVNSLLPEMPAWLEETLDSLVDGKLWAGFIAVSVFAPVCEEWLCRGVVLRGLLANNVKPWLAVVLSAFIFALIHLNPWQAVPAVCLGLLFGYVYYRTGSLKLTMWMHFVNNTFALVAGHYLSEVDSFQLLLGDLFWPVFAASVVVVALVFLALRRIELKDPSGNLERVPSLFEQ